MDSSVIISGDGELLVVENRNLKKKATGSYLAGPRTEAKAYTCIRTAFPSLEAETMTNSYSGRGRSRETSYARDYDRLCELLRYEKEHGGNILWVMGPAFAFDEGARQCMGRLIDVGYMQGLMAGNALATHDLEASCCTLPWDRTYIRAGACRTVTITTWMS